MHLKISSPMDYKVALYIRLSKEDDKDSESESVSNQRRLLREYTAAERLDVFDEYVDDGFTGTDFNRPDFLRLLSDIDSKKVNMVITKDMSRLGRDYIQIGFYLEKFFPENRIRYISLLDGIDTGTDSSLNDITPIKAIMNDMYAKDISKKIKSVKNYKQKQGLFIGGKAAYGYKIVDRNKIDIDEEVVGNVQRMFALALQGKSCRDIATIFTKEGIQTPANYAKINLSKQGIYSGKWSSERVTFMLKNQVYIGNMVQGRVKKVNYKSKKSIKLPKDDWTVVENTHPAIIDKDTFDKVQMLLNARTKTRSRTYDYLLKGLVYCHECGYLLAVINRKLANGETLYFMCRTHQRFTTYHQCSCHTIRVDMVTDAVLDQVRAVCANSLKASDLEDEALSALSKAKEMQRTDDEISVLSSKVSHLTLNLDRAYNDKLNGILEDDDFNRIYTRIKSERTSLQNKLSDLNAQKEKNVPNSVLAKELAQKFLETATQNKELIFSLIERIEITKEKEIQIKFKFPCLQ